MNKMKSIVRTIYEETASRYEVEINEDLVKDCQDYLSSVAIDKESIPELTAELIEDLYYEVPFISESELDKVIKFEEAGLIYDSAIKDILINFLDKYLDDYFIGAEPIDVCDSITEIRSYDNDY